jgi:hypothetical protein
MKEFVDGAQLLTDLTLFFQKYVRVEDDVYIMLAVWVLHTYAWLAWTRTPYLNVNSPVQECGKTLLCELIELVTWNPLLIMSMSAAVLAREIEQNHPTLLIDEFDQTLAGDKETLSLVMGAINSGYRKSGKRLVSVQVKGGWESRRLSVFCPKVLSGISGLPAITASRCIPINMQRMKPGERVADIDEYITEPEANELSNRCEVWSKAHLKQLRDARPEGLDTLGHRQREVSRPLLAIADAVENGWGERVRAALERLFTAKRDLPDINIRIRLLHDMRVVFGDRKRISSRDAASQLGADADAPWSSWGRSGKPIAQSQLAKQLVYFGVTPRVQRNDDGTNLRGYDRAQFEDLWERYPKLLSTPIPLFQTVTTVTTPINIDENAISRPSQESFCYGPKNAPDPHEQRTVTPVTGQTGGMGIEGVGMVCPVHHENTTWWHRQDGSLVCQRCHPKPRDAEINQVGKFTTKLTKEQEV